MSAMYRQTISIAILWLTITAVKNDENYRLNTTITPSYYTIRITPYFDTGNDRAFTFDGDVAVTFKTEVRTQQIKIHTEDLVFNETDIAVTTTSGVSVALDTANGLEFVKEYTFTYINLVTELEPNVDYLLRISYTGPIRKDLNGFYMNYYYENGVKKWLGATQMEPTHARKVFPCFDEPSLKAVFTLVIDRPANFQPSLGNTILANTETLSNGLVRETFSPSPRMSTYLVAFLVSEFTAAQTITVNGQEFGIFARPDAANQTDFAYSFGRRVVDALGDYYGIGYYSTDSKLKLDHIALPDFRAGAMENWGLIKYRESLLLYVPEESTPYYKYRVAQIVAHETTHMWFGNLVTCHWWSDTWLNEGFANYFQDYITAFVEPEVGSEDVLVTGSVYSAYDADDTPQSPPISNDKVYSPAEISGHFGTITYQKAGSVIRMIHHFIGNDAFKTGLNVYLSDNRFAPSYPNNLYSALEEGVTRSNSLANYPNTTLTNVMTSWITQAGYPIVNVDVDYVNGKITLSQKRFYKDSSQSSNETYKIPLTYATETSPDFNNTKPVFVMDTSSVTIDVESITEGQWIILNIQETGLYRVNYDSNTWTIISAALKGDKREDIHHLNRAKIVNDLFAFVYGDVVKFNQLYNVLDFLHNETDYSVWYAAIRGLNKLRNSYLGSDLLDDIENYALALMDVIINDLGFDVKPEDDYETIRNRMQVLEFACKLKHQGCIDHTVALFKGLKENGTEITPSLRPVSYCNGLRYGDGSDYDFLWQRMSTTNVANEARTIGEVLGCTNVEDKLREFLSAMLVEDSPIKTQDLTVPLTGVLGNYGHAHIVFSVLKGNYTFWSTVYPSMDTVISAIPPYLHTEDEFTEFEAFLSSCDECTEATKTAGTSALDVAKASTKWSDDHKADILSTFGNSGFEKTSSLFVVLLSVFITYMRM